MIKDNIIYPKLYDIHIDMVYMDDNKFNSITIQLLLSYTNINKLFIIGNR